LSNTTWFLARVSSSYKCSKVITSLIAFIIETSGFSDSVVIPTASSTGQNRFVGRPNAIGEGGEPLKTAGIYDALVARGYKFTFKESKKVLGIRLYKMLGVQPLGEGLFQAK
jgi:hypothetical protein